MTSRPSRALPAPVPAMSQLARRAGHQATTVRVIRTASVPLLVSFFPAPHVRRAGHQHGLHLERCKLGVLGTDQCGDASDVRRSEAVACADQVLLLQPGHFNVNSRCAKLNGWMWIVV